MMAAVNRHRCRPSCPPLAQLPARALALGRCPRCQWPLDEKACAEHLAARDLARRLLLLEAA